ncbi:hypothetical protein RF11_03845 [Thelohanellus kitauei]|uniref:Paired domain-containing protein n=1 Tax=Thelohanellus kitauei TaxID=669202 RepID=A0A0C2M9Z3_THEKT|nr:hypothetical protein RF11_03845 [Thelohanellus kitauei]
MVINDGKRRRKAARTLVISRSTVNKIIKIYNESGDLDAGYRGDSKNNVKELGYTYKITRPVYQKRNDETSKNLRREYVRWTHSWAPIGQTLNAVVSERTKSYNDSSDCLNIVHCEAITSSVNGDLFKELENRLVTTLGNAEKFTFVIDNFFNNYDRTEEETPPLGTDDLIGRMRDICVHAISEHLKNLYAMQNVILKIVYR